MPCYSTVLNEVSLQGMGTGDKLKAALLGIGAQVVMSEGRVTSFWYEGRGHTVSSDGRISADVSVDTLNRLRGQVRVSYSAEIIKAQARRNGWAVKKVAANKYQVIKRGS